MPLDESPSRARKTFFGWQRVLELFALVAVSILLGTRYPQPRHSTAVHCALPARKLLKAERIKAARLIDREKPTSDSCDDLSLAAGDPAYLVSARQGLERKRLAKWSDDMGRTDLLVRQGFHSHLLHDRE